MSRSIVSSPQATTLLAKAVEAGHALLRWPWLDTLATLRRRMREDRLGQAAGSLTFSTLIALVPLLTVMLAVFTAFPMFSSFQVALEQYFLQTLVPDGIARPVMRSLTQFAAKARGVGSVGLLLLVATALSVMLTIDRTLNGIWRVRRPRPLAQRILVYWTALTLGPLAVGVSLTVTSYALSASRGLVGKMPGGLNFAVDLLQFSLLAAAIALLYHHVPNTFVRWRHAWAGAIFVAAAFEGAKSLLAWYVASMGSFSAVYGTFAAAPILMLWIYLGWLIVLLGAVIAAYAPSLQLRRVRLADRPGGRFALALQALAQLQQQRGGASLAALAQRLGVDPIQLEPVLDRLVGLGWVGRLEESGARRHVLLVDAANQPLLPLVEVLLLAPDEASGAVLARLREMTLAEALRA